MLLAEMQLDNKIGGFYIWQTPKLPFLFNTEEIGELKYEYCIWEKNITILIFDVIPSINHSNLYSCIEGGY